MKRILAITIAAVFGLLAFVASPRALAQVGDWTVTVFDNVNLRGQPVATYTTNFLNLNWGYGAPVAGMNPDNFSARFSSYKYFNAGTYRFSVVADDEFVLRVNGVEYLNSFGGGGNPGKLYTVDVNLPQGYSTLEVDYREFTEQAYIRLNYRFIKPTPPAPPVTTPTPPQDSARVVTNYGDFTPCIQQNLHQVNCFDPSGAWDSPDTGSIRLEPQIELWRECQPDNVVRLVLRAGQGETDAKCSKSGAGYYPA